MDCFRYDVEFLDSLQAKREFFGFPFDRFSVTESLSRGAPLTIVSGSTRTTSAIRPCILTIAVRIASAISASGPELPGGAGRRSCTMTTRFTRSARKRTVACRGNRSR
jgi:hypothetical protein